MKKVVINDCFGGFGLSPLAVQKMAERNGRQCYFFKSDVSSSGDGWTTTRVTAEEAAKSFMWSAFDIPDVAPLCLDAKWQAKTPAERDEHNALYRKHRLEQSDIPRDDRDLVAVVQELGDAANGSFAKLKIVEIPDDAEWEISEYDGNEHIAEVHRTWS